MQSQPVTQKCLTYADCLAAAAPVEATSEAYQSDSTITSGSKATKKGNSDHSSHCSWSYALYNQVLETAADRLRKCFQRTFR
jgi:hypothetical protein